VAVHGRLDATGSVPLSEQRIHLKPHGLWYACGTGWIDYAARVFNQVDPYVYGIDVNLSGMRVIRTNEELAAFTDEFGATRYTGDGTSRLAASGPRRPWSGGPSWPAAAT